MPKKKNKGIRLPPSLLASTKGGKSWFFGIGIDHYQHFPNLHNAVKDVEDVVVLLEKKYVLHEKILLFNQQASKENITNQLEYLTDKVALEDKLIIYFSGHGFLKKETGYWIPVDAEPDKRGNFIRNEVILGSIKDIDAKHTLLISDSCFSGSLVTREAFDPNIALEELERDKSRWIISSGRGTETVSDGTPGKNSPFATSEEWKDLRFGFGGDPSSAALPNRAYRALIPGGESGFKATFGGWYRPDDDFVGISKIGYYWSSSVDDEGKAMCSSFDNPSMEFSFTDKATAFSCRCLKD